MTKPVQTFIAMRNFFGLLRVMAAIRFLCTYYQRRFSLRPREQGPDEANSIYPAFSKVGRHALEKIKHGLWILALHG